MDSMCSCASAEDLYEQKQTFWGQVNAILISWLLTDVING